MVPYGPVRRLECIRTEVVVTLETAWTRVPLMDNQYSIRRSYLANEECLLTTLNITPDWYEQGFQTSSLNQTSASTLGLSVGLG